MKKMLSKINKKFIVAVATIIVILTTILACKIYAETIADEMTSTGSGMANGREGATGSLYRDDLLDRYDIFCSSEGTNIPFLNSGSYTKYVVESVNYATPMEAYILAEMVNDIGVLSSSEIVFETNGAGNKIEYTDIDTLYSSETISFDNKVLYIINEKDKIQNGSTTNQDTISSNGKLVMQGDDGKYYYVEKSTNTGYISYADIYSYVQRAWWNTEAGSKGNAIPPNELSVEAEQFESYINQFGDTKVIMQTITDENGKERTVPAPNLEFKAEFVDTNPTVAWNDEEQSYLVGPFAIDYIEASSSSTGRKTVMFSGISNVELYTDASSEPMTLGEEWEFHWINRDVSDKTTYPHTGEDFYIKLKYKEDVTEITNIKFEFKYMNAGGMYEELEGKYYTPVKYGNTVSIRERVAQSLAGGLIGTRWYEEDELNWEPEINSGRIKIVKNIINEDGEQVTSFDENTYFTFRVTVDGKSELIKVKAGSSVMSNVYIWEGEKAPSYTVEEITSEGYELVELRNAQGQLKNGTVEVVAVNKILNKQGNLKVVKKITKPATVDQEFAVVVKVSGNFKYNGVSYKNQTLTIPVKLRILAGQTETAVLLNGFTWAEGDAPQYTVTEDTNYNTSYELVSINPKKGTFKENETTSVTIINERVQKKARLHIIKTLENANLYTNEYIESLVFKFEIRVDGYGKNVIKLKPVRQNNQYIWSYISDYYYMEQDEVLNYTIKEIDLPEGTKFVGADSNDTTLTIDGTTIKGVLSDVDGDLKVVNNIINKIEAPDIYSGSIRLTKVVNSDTLSDKEYTFVVKVSGTFKYQGNSCENSTMTIPVKIRVPAGQLESAVLLEGFTWNGKAPTYFVEEDLNGLDGIQSTINQREGTLEKNTEIKIIAENRTKTSKKGSLHIIKTLEDADKFSNEYIKSLVFKFRITVAGRDYGVISLQPELVNNTYIWEHRSEYTWSEDEPNPTYTIEEVELPEGTEFVSATSSNGTASGMKVTGTLKPDSEEDYIVKNEFINKLTFDEVENKGYLKVQKKVTEECLIGKTFNITGKIKGTFEYNGSKYENSELPLNILVNGGDTWTSGEIKWYGENAPTYVLEEEDSDIANLVSVINNSGTLVAGGVAEAQVATFTNSAEKESGRIQITKKIEDGASSEETFYFEIAVDGYEKYTVGIKPGQTYRSEQFKWQAGAEAPRYTVTELDSKTAKFVSISNGTKTSTNKSISGSLEKDGIVSVVCINKLESYSGKLRVTKEVIVDEKLQNEAIDGEFTINVVISGTFEMNNESIVDSTRVITETLFAGEYFETPEIKWYGDVAPTYTVTETSIPNGWKLENISNGNGQLEANTTAQSIVTNSLSTRVELDLTMELAGHVWEDTKVEYKEIEQTDVYGTQGIYDEKIEKGIDGVEVYIYKVIYDAKNVEVSRELGTAYEEGSNLKISFPLYTTNGGYWSSPRMSVPVLTQEQKDSGYKVAYDVEFVYDGQTYEPTTFLKTSNGDSNAYRAATTSKRDAWAKDSMALDYNREEVNNRIAQILGDSPIDGQGNTIGIVSGTQQGETAIYYEAADYSEGLSSSRKVSELQTTDSNGNIYNIYKTKARTSTGGLTYPFDSKYHLESVDKYIDELGLVERYKYTATYNYTLNINLGLIKREDADIGTTKDLYSAKVIVNGKAMNYRFNTLADLTGSTISRQLKVDDMNIQYQLGLYNTDYYYRAELYQTNGTMYDAVENFYKSLGITPDSTELDVYLTYKINIYNESPNYLVGINSINDYFDSSFGAPITSAETKYIQTEDGVVVEKVTEVANKSQVVTSLGNKLDVSWEVTDKNIKGSDGTTYNKMTANFGTKELVLTSGEKAEITVTFKVQKDNYEGVKNAVILGQKANVAELANYSTYYQDGKIAGKIDRDSAPGNANIEEYNDRAWYEDDTDPAPILNLSIVAEQREIDGIAFEDKPDTTLEYNQKVGNGVYDEGEALIGGLTTQLIEKVLVQTPGTTQYTEYDFLWPTNRALDILGGRTMEYLTGFDSTIETSRTQAAADDAEGLDLGEYRFENVPAGNYVVRFLYGNDKTELEDSENISGEPVALKLDGAGNVVYYSNNDRILTANYEGKLEGKTPSVYNGHDYKTTTYQAGVSNTDADGYINNEWHNLNLGETRLSDARDSEARRLETIAKSTTITNVNGSVLATANTIEANRTDLYKDYYMFADTAKINLTIEDADINEIVGEENLPNGIKVKEIKGTMLKDGIVQTNIVVYTVKNIDIGLEERSETNIVLDKQISSIKLITSDGRTIFDAIYDISYEEISPAEYALGGYTKVLERDGKYLVAKVSLNANSVGTDVLQAINKVEDKDKAKGTQNFRFINVDDTILQGCTIQIGYQLTALNVSEVDKVDSKLENIEQTAKANNTTVEAELLKVAKTIKENNATYTKVGSELKNNIKIGSYLGKTYYKGKDAAAGDVVTTLTVRQLVDYVDNDAVFMSSENRDIDNSWRNVTINEIKGNGFEEYRLISKDIIRENNIKDKSDKFYITDQKNNLIVSVDSREDTATLTNKGFEVKLLPYDADNTKYSSKITLKTSKVIAAESDANSLAFDNLAEIVKYDISTGRRDLTSTPGNANPAKGEFEVSVDERDSSATELITLTPPTGINAWSELILQILAIVGISLGIIVIGIVIIKKKVLTK